MIVLSSRKPKARKNHVCDFCLGVIEKGTVYESQTNVYDGLYVWKSHADCTKIANHLNMFDDCDEGLTGEDFQEFITTEYCDLNFAFEKSFDKKLEFVIKHHLNPDS